MLKKLAGFLKRPAIRKPAPAERVADRSSAKELLEAAQMAYAAREWDEAAALAESAIKKSHDLAEGHLLLGMIHCKAQRFEDAEDCFHLAACFDPGAPEGDYQLALLALRRGDQAEGRRILEKIVAAHAAHAEARVNLGKLLIDQGEYGRAETLFREAIKAEPANVHALSNLGFVLLEARDQPDEALGFIDEAIRIDPGFANAHCNRSMVLQYLGRCEEAVAASDRALALEPGMVQARLNRAMALLMMGDFARGWTEYEVRRHLHPSLQRPLPGAEWHGQELTNKMVLVHAEQGLGDEIMFASCVPELLSRAGGVILECHTKLEPLFARSFPDATVVGASQGSNDLSWLQRVPAPDYRVPIGSLPRHFRTEAADFPRHAGYLRAEPSRVAYWRSRLDQLGPGRKIGLSWRGGSSRQVYRSIPIVEFLPLLQMDGFRFISLQYTDCAAELRSLCAEHGIVVHHWQEAIDNYDETAALVCALDRVLTVQTAVAHLAGALGRPVWVMVPAVPEWRYQRSGDSLPWYPSMKMFRQSRLGDWRSVLDSIARELRPADIG